MQYDKTKWKWWQDALAGLNPPVVANTPMQGFYAFKPARDAQPEPVAIWYEGSGELKCLVGKSRSKEPHRIWEWCSRHPISHATYKEVQGGQPWPHEIRITLDGGEEQSTLTGVGHNSGDDEQALFGNIEEWTSQAQRALKKGIPQTKEDADALSDLATKLHDLTKEAEERRKSLTQPLLDQQRELKARFDQKTSPAKLIVQQLKGAVGLWLKKENDSRKEQVEAAQAIVGEGVEISAAKAGAGTRRTITTVKRTVAVIDDLAAAAAYMAGMDKPPADFKEAIAANALRLLRAGITVPGAHLETNEVVR